ncbi:MAG TPA: ATPase [Paludibacteraceae bacterium]|nr:ATPase [Paludibacteraceae bacterium]HOU69577.1 ATPase [Paludibacteraceae bacterium]HPH63947.1 ATPase [Paludibacteraceae bacterium]HQF51240.1 ATPase [Paludibacteraceae bacterium]
MYIIVDSGSTKTELKLQGDNFPNSDSIIIPGINPFYQTEKEIANLLQSAINMELPAQSIRKIYFYGAGCSFPEKKAMVANALRTFFSNAEVDVENDLLAASRALFGDQKGIACILGTGSNSCLYNGKEIEMNVSPLGFILGDEGSGAVIGKKFVADCLKNQLPTELKDKFLERYNTTPQEIMDNVYKKSFPNRYLASLCHFLLENIEDAHIQKIIRDSFGEFFDRNIRQYPQKGDKLGFVGSVAFLFKDLLTEVAETKGYKIEKIIRAPMDGLVAYHAKKQMQ